MSTATGGKRDVMHSKWTVPVFSAILGLVLLAALAAGHQLVTGLWSLGIMWLFGIAVFLGGRSETVRGLRGDGRDERFAMLDLQATALAGLALMLALGALAGALLQRRRAVRFHGVGADRAHVDHELAGEFGFQNAVRAVVDRLGRGVIEQHHDDGIAAFHEFGR